MKKRTLRFKNEDEERDFWSKNDSSEYLDWKSAGRALFPNLKSSTDSGEFDAIIRQARKQAKKAGIKQKDIRSAVVKVRKHK